MSLVQNMPVCCTAFMQTNDAYGVINKGNASGEMSRTFLSLFNDTARMLRMVNTSVEAK